MKLTLKAYLAVELKAVREQLQHLEPQVKKLKEKEQRTLELLADQPELDIHEEE